MRRSSGFTIVELLIALALAGIISLCISKVSSDAQHVFRETTARVELYQKFRYALEDVQNAIKNWEVTSDLEFFVDQQGAPNGHWDEGEEIKSRSNIDGGRAGVYDEAALLIEEQYQYDRGFGATEAEFERHDNFTLYFRAPTIVNGALRVANVEYFLADPTQGEGVKARGVLTDPAAKNLSLVKVVRWIDTSQAEFFKVERKVNVKISELCQNVTDFKVEYFYDNEHDSGPGMFLTPSREFEGDLVKSEIRPETIGDEVYMKRFMYGGFDLKYTVRGRAKKGDREADTGRFTPIEFSVGSAESGVNFSELAFDDRLYLFKDSSSTGGSWRDGDYHIFQKYTGRLRFQEHIDSSTWEGDQSGIRVKAGYVPSSVRVSITVLNDEGRKPRTLQSIMHPFRKRA